MKKGLGKVILGIGAVICLSFGLAACNEKNEETGVWGDEYTMSAAYSKAQELGYTGTLEEFIAAISGKDGQSAYDIWLENGHAGTEEDFLNWLKADVHTHEFGAKTTLIPATCVTGGYDIRICNECKLAQIIVTETNNHIYDDNDICSVCKQHRPSEGLEFKLINWNNAYEVCGIGSCTDTEIYIPKEYNGKPVTSIGHSAFWGRSKLTSITIPDSVTRIGSSAFSSCGGLTSITIPNSVASIGMSAFAYCSRLTSITIPNSVASIGMSAFAYCSGLTNITIPDGVTNIDYGAFEGCSGLKSITVEKNNKNYKSIDGNLYSKDGTALIQYAVAKTDSTFTIPDGVTSIESYAFYRCSGLTSIKIPDGVTSIGRAAFSNCSGLTSIKIPDGVTSIGDSAFSGCSGLTSIKIPDGVTSIGDSAFSGCSGLTSITIPDGVTSIGSYVFYGCNKIIQIENGIQYVDTWVIDCDPSVSEAVLKNGTKGIANFAFYECSGLTSITIPDSVKSIGDYAFRDCSGLTNITIPDGVKSIGIQAFIYCSSLTSITIPDTVTSIGNSAFVGCSGLTSINIPKSVKSIGEQAFFDCSGLTSITVAEDNQNYKSIDGNLYSKDGTKLIQYAVAKTDSTFTIPDGVTSIESYAFYRCSGLTNVYYKGTAEDWAKISIGNYNSELENATLYYYSETEPELNADGTAYNGNYWHYDTDGVTPVVWKKN